MSTPIQSEVTLGLVRMATILTPTKTPVKYSSCFNLTPSAKNVCIVCEKREDRPTCRRYFYQNTVKTDACKFLEEALDITISFQGVACSACIGRTRTAYQRLSLFKKNANENVQKIKEKYQTVSTKRCTRGSPASRKSLFPKEKFAEKEMASNPKGKIEVSTGFEMLLMCVCGGGGGL